MIGRMIRWNVRIFALMFAAVLLVACFNDEPTVDERFVDAFVDMRAMEMMYGAQSPTTRVARREILQKYGYTQETFLAMSEKIQADEHYWLPFQKKVVNRLDSVLDPEAFVKKKEEEAEKAKKKKSKDKAKPEDKE